MRPPRWPPWPRSAPGTSESDAGRSETSSGCCGWCRTDVCGTPRAGAPTSGPPEGTPPDRRHWSDVFGTGAAKAFQPSAPSTHWLKRELGVKIPETVILEIKGKPKRRYHMDSEGLLQAASMKTSAELLRVLRDFVRRAGRPRLPAAGGAESPRACAGRPGQASQRPLGCPAPGRRGASGELFDRVGPRPCRSRRRAVRAGPGAGSADRRRGAQLCRRHRAPDEHRGGAGADEGRWEAAAGVLAAHPEPAGPGAERAGRGAHALRHVRLRRAECRVRAAAAAASESHLRHPGHSQGRQHDLDSSSTTEASITASEGRYTTLSTTTWPPSSTSFTTAELSMAWHRNTTESSSPTMSFMNVSSTSRLTSSTAMSSTTLSANARHDEVEHDAPVQNSRIEQYHGADYDCVEHLSPRRRLDAGPLQDSASALPDLALPHASARLDAAVTFCVETCADSRPSQIYGTSRCTTASPWLAFLAPARPSPALDGAGAALGLLLGSLQDHTVKLAGVLEADALLVYSSRVGIFVACDIGIVAFGTPMVDLAVVVPCAAQSHDAIGFVAHSVGTRVCHRADYDDSRGVLRPGWHVLAAATSAMHERAADSSGGGERRSAAAADLGGDEAAAGGFDDSTPSRSSRRKHKRDKHKPDTGSDPRPPAGAPKSNMEVLKELRVLGISAETGYRTADIVAAISQCEGSTPRAVKLLWARCPERRPTAGVPDAQPQPAAGRAEPSAAAAARPPGGEDAACDAGHGVAGRKFFEKAGGGDARWKVLQGRSWPGRAA
ncbi:unnamed protein product [Prorocentrum cordatum]|uniref:Uncharacterized protein n=1 Tax=Prorocentrum cordatum TaxID=2364126 RepID=A0ABN9U5E6_9DINO|nr:unnamed protein product [Polarella glacialis]